jgi:hypothetical protein
MILLGAAVCASLATSVLARRAVVTTADGRQLEGEVLSDNDEGVTLEIAGIRTPIARDQVKDVQYKASVEDEFKTRRAAIKDDDATARYELAYWLYQQKRYDLAAQELADMAKRFPDDEQVRLLARAVEREQRMLDEQREAAAPKPTPTPAPAPGATTVRPAPNSTNAGDARLTKEDINLIRVYDVDLGSVRALNVPHGVLNDFIDKYSAEDQSLRGKDNQNALRRASETTKLAKIFERRAREFYPLVTVSDDPPQLRLFKQSVHTPYVLNYCGTANCHGSDAAPGGYYVFRQNPREDRTIYSNFLTLYRTETGNGYLVDVERPEDSLLLHYGMRPEQAGVVHPQVTGWKPQILSTDDVTYRSILAWIRSYRGIRQKYPITYNPPGGASTTQPAEAPATPAPTPAPAR